MTRIDQALHAAAEIAAERWHPKDFTIIEVLDEAAKADDAVDAIDLWDAVVTYLDERLTVDWEKEPGRTREQVVEMLHAATEVTL